MRHDITWPLYVEVDRIYNLACPASPVHYQFDPAHPPGLHLRGVRRPDPAPADGVVLGERVCYVDDLVTGMIAMMH
jgi:hypothetical protein